MEKGAVFAFASFDREQRPKQFHGMLREDLRATEPVPGAGP
jgi:hypothetical protein